MAKLYFKHGPMGSQKTTDLLATAHNFEQHGGKVLVAKPAGDTKGESDLVSRIGLRRMADFLIAPQMDVAAEVLRRKKEMSRLSAVLIDEAQFLRPEQIDQLFMLVVAHAIPVMTWGLRVDFRTHLFPGSRRLLELAHVVREAITMCGHGDGCENRAHLNARLVNGVYVHQGEQIAIDDGPEVSYKALCPKHYLQNVGQITADPA